MNCEMCGKDDADYKTLIEGIELTVCSKCSSHGKVLRQPEVISTKKEIKQFQKKEQPEIISKIIPDYGPKIRKARTKKNMTQEEFAQKLSIKESLLNKIENSSFTPSLPLAQKLEKSLKIRLIEEVEEAKIKIKKEETEAVTIGDLIDLE